MDFLTLIEDTHKATTKEEEVISFVEYLSILKNDPNIYKLAHQRIYQLLNVQSSFKEAFYGIDQALAKINNYFYAAANGGEESRQILYLVGPVGGGKSSIINFIKHSLENTSPIYHLDGCPMHEEPLHLIPSAYRAAFEDILNLKIEGELCPKCNYRLMHEFNGKYENFPVTTTQINIKKRIGIGVVPPVDSNNQDASVLIGSVNISKLDQYPEDDPRVFSLNGAFHFANRGLIEFIEVFKNDIEYLYTMLTATQEKMIPSPAKGEMIYFDGVILAHSNESEWIKFKSDKTNEAILDRIVCIKIPYCLIVDQEVQIYRKLLSKTTFNFHLAPYTLTVAAQFAVLTRLHPTPDMFDRLKLYNASQFSQPEMAHQNVNTSKFSQSEMSHQNVNANTHHEDEGMFGVSSRFIMKVFGAAFAKHHKCACLSPLNFLDILADEINNLPISTTLKNQYINFIEIYIKKDYNDILQQDILKYFTHTFANQAQSIFNKYLDFAIAFSNDDQSIVDEPFMLDIEQKIDISQNASAGFRIDLANYLQAELKCGRTLTYNSYPPLKKAIEQKMLSNLKGGFCSLIDKTNAINLLLDNGYCLNCADSILEYLADFIDRS
ncbi:MAG: serine protein kinase [Candidatus Epulonipiscioides saccharophilum]|nr:MAG: serine protein kinase [Epulopiscium sp. AS2M-Bin001]